MLIPGGLFCIIEHNPWNPATRAIVRDVRLMQTRNSYRAKTSTTAPGCRLSNAEHRLLSSICRRRCSTSLVF